MVFFFEKRRSENRFCCLFSGSIGLNWVIIRIEIKMKSCVSLSSNLPRVIDRSNLSPRHFANYKTIMHSFSFLFLKASISYLSLLRRCDLLFVWVFFFFFFFWIFWKKCVCPPLPHFSAPSYATGTFSAHKAKAQVHFCDHAQSIVFINPSSVPPSF